MSEEAKQGKNLLSWSVWRQDDNGNSFLIQTGLTEAAAKELVRHYEALGHKQLYWAREENGAV